MPKKKKYSNAKRLKSQKEDKRVLEFKTDGQGMVILSNYLVTVELKYFVMMVKKELVLFVGN